MARACVEYLLLEEVSHLARRHAGEIRRPREYMLRYDDTQRKFRDYLRALKMDGEDEIYGLLLYSSEHWPAHFRNARFKLKDAIISKARGLSRVEGDQFQLWFPLFWSFRPNHDQPDMNDIRFAAFTDTS